MSPFLNTLIRLLQGLFSAKKPPASLGAGGGDESSRFALSANTDPITSQSHVLVLPDDDFRAWYEATRDYTAHFDNVIIARSPAGNNLNRYRIVTTVTARRVWFNDDPLGHVRRAYPSVVTVDLISATNPTQLKQALDQRIAGDQRYGTPSNQHTRFVLDWALDSQTLRFTRFFDEPLGNGKFHEGVDLAGAAGMTVRAAASGTVFDVAGEPNTLGYGTYVQVRTQTDGKEYMVTYTHLRDVQVVIGQTLRVGDVIGACGTSWGIKLVVQQGDIDTGTRYKVAGAVDPLRLFYVEGMTLHTTATLGLNIRKGRGTEHEIVGKMAPNDSARTVELHGITIRKTGTDESEDQWINLDTSKGVTGYGAAWYLQAKSPRSGRASVGFNGVNLDLMHRIGAPDPARLGDVTYVRLPYNVSMGRGNQDLDAAYDMYAPYLDRLLAAGKRVILVYTHQTFGEGAGYVWERMNSGRWRELGARLGDFINIIVRQYESRGVIAAHQIWNEQDAPTGAAASVRMNAEDYAGILTTAIQAIRSEDRVTPIITGGHTGGPGNGVAYAKQTLSVMPSGVRPDGIAAHPYGRGTQTDSRYAQFGHIDETIQAYGGILPGKPIWITEWGVLDAPTDPVEQVKAYAGDMIGYLQRAYPDQVAALVWYAWADGMHNGYGLVNASDQPKEPLYSTYLTTR